MAKSALIRLRAGLKHHFGAQAECFVDSVLWLAGRVSVDLLRLDDWLVKSHPDYRDNESMRDFVRRKYGGKAERFLKYWLRGEVR